MSREAKTQSSKKRQNSSLLIKTSQYRKQYYETWHIQNKLDFTRFIETPTLIVSYDKKKSKQVILQLISSLKSIHLYSTYMEIYIII